MMKIGINNKRICIVDDKKNSKKNFLQEKNLNAI